MLEAHDIFKKYGGTSALESVSFALGPGLCAVTGPNGAGKSTLLRIASGAELPDGGAITLDGADIHTSVPEIFRHIAFLSDKVPLYADMTVEDHLNYRGRLKGITSLRLRAKIRHLAEILDLKPIFAKRTGALSGGQRKRVGIADAMLTDSKLLAIDEPFAGLDPVHCTMTAAALASAARHSIVLLATHRPDLLPSSSTSCLVLASGSLAARIEPSDGNKAPLAVRIAEAVSDFYNRGRVSAS